MGKYKDLLKNFGFLTISNFGSKILGFLLIPLYTYVLTTEQYGNFDLINTTILLLVPILTLSISDAPVRFLFEYKEKRDKVFSISFKITFIGIIIFCLIAIINYYLNIISIFNQYILFFVLMFITNSIYQVLQGLTRGSDKMFDLAISGLINSILMIGFNILFLLSFKWGLNGYFLAYILSSVISSLYLIIRLKCYKINFKNRRDKKLEKEMMDYSKPMIFNSVGWWINNASDRYVVTFICGLAANGIYSIAYKIPSILSTLQSIFNQAWTVSAIKTYNESQEEYYINVYKICNIIIVTCCSFLIVFTKLFAKILYLNDFYIAWKYTPFLLISVVFGTMSGIIGGIFAAYKETKIIGKTTIIGAIINTIFNILLVYLFGPVGAALATMISYFFIFIIRINNLKNKLNFSINIKKDLVSYFVLLVQSFLLIYLQKFIYVIEVVLFAIIIIIYRKDIHNIVETVLNKFLKRKDVKSC